MNQTLTFAEQMKLTPWEFHSYGGRLYRLWSPDPDGYMTRFEDENGHLITFPTRSHHFQDYNKAIVYLLIEGGVVTSHNPVVYSDRLDIYRIDTEGFRFWTTYMIRDWTIYTNGHYYSTVRTLENPDHHSLVNMDTLEVLPGTGECSGMIPMGDDAYDDYPLVGIFIRRADEESYFAYVYSLILKRPILDMVFYGIKTIDDLPMPDRITSAFDIFEAPGTHVLRIFALHKLTHDIVWMVELDPSYTITYSEEWERQTTLPRAYYILTDTRLPETSPREGLLEIIWSETTIMAKVLCPAEYDDFVYDGETFLGLIDGEVALTLSP